MADLGVAPGPLDPGEPWEESDDPDGAEPAPIPLQVAVPADLAPTRLDKALTDHAPPFEGARLSRARIQALIGAGAVTLDGGRVLDPAARAGPGRTYQILAPPARAAEPEAQALPLKVLFEDEDLIVIDKAPGMAAHPAPGTPDRTLVNALLHHCGPGLAGIGGVLRPGIVHRLDKDTSGVMVAAKTPRAHQGLCALFAAHDLERTYIALVRGAPEPLSGIIATQIGRARYDRQRMAVLSAGGRRAVTRYRAETVYQPKRGPSIKPAAARIACTLETGRTHQIRVHLAHKGAPVLGDAIYGSSPQVSALREAVLVSGLGRQALHAAVLGFRHPVTGAALRFETPIPPDMAALESELQTRFFGDSIKIGP